LENVDISVFKLSEDEQGWVIRCVETLGRAASGTVYLPLLGRSIPIDLSPWQIGTFYLPREEGAEAFRVNLLEMRE
jgi:alpha-mannosidase